MRRFGWVVGSIGLALGAVLAVGAPAGAAVIIRTSGNVNPQTQNQEGRCAEGERWVYVSPEVESSYNPLAKTTDSAGADDNVATHADLFADGVTMTIEPGGIYATFTINEATDPNTDIVVGKVVIKANGHYTIYTGADATPGVPLSDPPTGAYQGISHSYVCYSVVPSVGISGVPLPLVVPGLLVSVPIALVYWRRSAGRARAGRLAA